MQRDLVVILQIFRGDGQCYPRWIKSVVSGLDPLAPESNFSDARLYGSDYPPSKFVVWEKIRSLDWGSQERHEGHFDVHAGLAKRGKDLASCWSIMVCPIFCEREIRFKPVIRDILHELTRDFPLPESKPSSKKRPRGSNGPQDSEKGKEAVSKENRNIASARRPYSDPAFLQLSHQSSPGPSHHTSPGSNSSVSEPSTDSPSFMYSSSRCENINLPMYGKELGQIPLHGPFTFRAAPQPQVDSQTTPSSASSGSWYPAYTENAGIEQAHYSGFTNSLLHQQPLTGLLEEMRPHGPSDRVINSGTMPMRNAAVPITPQRFLQETVPSNINPMTSHTAYDVQPNPGIPTLPLRQHSQGHRHLENVSAVDPGMGMPGIDMGTINSDVMSMWLNASPTSLWVFVSDGGFPFH